MPTHTQSSMHEKFLDFMNHPVVKGSMLGAGAMFLVTPGINRFNHGRKMPWSQAFVGWQPLALSGMVGCAASFYVKDMLGGNKKNASHFQQFWTSATAGAFSGITLCPFEAVNRNQKKGDTLRYTVDSIVKHRGYAGFFNGTISMMARESGWVVMYMTAVAMISQNLREKGYNRASADAFALIFSACLFGFASTPVNRMRAMKQEGLTMPGKTPSYWHLASTLFNEHPTKAPAHKIANCFKGAGVRSATSAFAGALFYYGSQAYDHVVPKNGCSR
jgi:hypothetical protein